MGKKISREACLPLLVFTLFLLLAGCSGLVQKGGEFLEGSSGEITLAVYRSTETEKKTVELREIVPEDGIWSLEISSSEWPGLFLKGNMPSGNGSFEFYQARFLSSNAKGWNEFIMDIQGKGSFDNPKQTGAVLGIDGDIERIQISSGKIRMKSSRVTGNAALTALRNRRERILALTEWMKDPERMGVFADQKEFGQFWKPRLFPELVSKRTRPPEYTGENAEWRRENGVNWNRSYTRQLFPEGLWEFRDSGAMLRDWEEALPWIFLEYSWETIISSFNNITLQRVSR
jgi:hypothetical protein